MKLGLFSIAYEDVPLESILRHISSLGYESIELPAWKGNPHLDLDRILSGGAQEVKNLVSKYGITISGLNNYIEGQLVLGPYDGSTDFIFKGSEIEKQNYGISRIKKTAEAAKLLDVPVVNGFVGCPNWSAWYPEPPPYEEIYAGFFNIFAEKWNGILDYFGSNGVKFAFEVHPAQVAYNIETAELVLDSIKWRTEFGFNFDPSHLVWQLLDPVLFIKKFGKKIYHSHVKDGELVVENLPTSGAMSHGSLLRSTRGFRFRVPGWGQVPWRRVMTAFAEVGYDYVLSYEHEDPIIGRDDGLEMTMSFIKPLLIRKKPRSN